MTSPAGSGRRCRRGCERRGERGKKNKKKKKKPPPLPFPPLPPPRFIKPVAEINRKGVGRSSGESCERCQKGTVNGLYLSLPSPSKLRVENCPAEATSRPPRARWRRSRPRVCGAPCVSPTPATPPCPRVGLGGVLALRGVGGRRGAARRRRRGGGRSPAWPSAGSRSPCPFSKAPAVGCSLQSGSCSQTDRNGL